MHGLSCAGVSAEWLRCVDGSLRLVAVHSMDWAGDEASATDLARVASSLSVALPPGTRGLGREQAGGLQPGAGVKPGWNTNTAKMTTFQAGSPFRPDRAEPPPPTVHPPSEVTPPPAAKSPREAHTRSAARSRALGFPLCIDNQCDRSDAVVIGCSQNPENKRERRQVVKASDVAAPRRPPAIRQAMAIVGGPESPPRRRPSGSPPRREAAPRTEVDLDLLLEESSTFSARGEASYRIPYADLSHLDEEVGNGPATA